MNFKKIGSEITKGSTQSMEPTKKTFFEKRGRKNPVSAELFIRLIDNFAFIGGKK